MKNLVLLALLVFSLDGFSQSTRWTCFTTVGDGAGEVSAPIEEYGEKADLIKKQVSLGINSSDNLRTITLYKSADIETKVISHEGSFYIFIYQNGKISNISKEQTLQSNRVSKKHNNIYVECSRLSTTKVSQNSGRKGDNSQRPSLFKDPETLKRTENDLIISGEATQR